MRSIIAFSAFVSCFSVSAQECANLIALSKTVSSTVAEKSAFEKHTSNFCNEYKKGGSRAASTNAGASWKFISASFGQSSMSTEEVASKVCSASSGESTSSDAYKQYVETIAAGAYSAYETCIRFKDTNDLRFDVDLASVLPSEFTISIGYSQAIQGANTAELSYSASSGVTCAWNGISSAATKLNAPSSVLVHCSRKDQGKPGYAKFIRTNGIGGSMTIPLPAYDNNGIPINTLASLNKTISDLRIQVDSLEELKRTVSALSSPVPAAQDVAYSASRGGGASAMTMSSYCPAGQVVIGVEMIVGGTCHGQCEPDGGALHKFRVKCAPRFNAVK
ncbi:MAG: hypothetical protein HYY98_10775 [Burkholderiales bacterium]|nr:hypothetical protein [Burkholderiales bacterium]